MNLDPEEYKKAEREFEQRNQELADSEARFRQRNPEVFKEPIRNFDPNRPLADQMDRTDWMLARVVVDAEAYAYLAGTRPQAASLESARTYLRERGIVPESVYYGGSFYLQALRERNTAT